MFQLYIMPVPRAGGNMSITCNNDNNNNINNNNSYYYKRSDMY